MNYIPKSEKVKSIINDPNMLFDLKEDKVFKAVFNSKEGRGLLAKCKKKEKEEN